MVRFSTPAVVSYEADRIAGGVASVYDIALFRWAAFEFPHMSVAPPGDTATLLGWSRSTNAALCVAFRVTLR